MIYRCYLSDLLGNLFIIPCSLKWQPFKLIHHLIFMNIFVPLFSVRMCAPFNLVFNTRKYDNYLELQHYHVAQKIICHFYSRVYVFFQAKGSQTTIEPNVCRHSAFCSNKLVQLHTKIVA